jgi:hypothetical protein
MGLLTREERAKLRALLQRLPGVSTDRARRRLLIGSQPPTILNLISFSDSALVDIDSIISLTDSDGAQQENGDWPITWVIEDAIHMASGLKLERELNELLNTVRSRAASQPTVDDPRSRPESEPPPPDAEHRRRPQPEPPPPDDRDFFGTVSQRSFANSLRMLRELHSLTGKLSDNASWKVISHSILIISEHLLEWGKLIGAPFAPNKQTVQEVAEGLHQLENGLITLDFWLSWRSSERWRRLQQGLHTAREAHWNQSSKSALSIYAAWLEESLWRSRADANMRVWYEERRMIAGTSIVTFAHALRQAVEMAQLASL